METLTDSGLANQQTNLRPPTSLVLQPRGELDSSTSAAFQVRLEQALHCATKAIVIDLMWVEAIDPAGLEVLKAGVCLAAGLGKNLSFKSLPAKIWAELEVEQITLRSKALGSWATAHREDLDRFLSQPRKPAAPLEDDISTVATIGIRAAIGVQSQKIA